MKHFIVVLLIICAAAQKIEQQAPGIRAIVQIQPAANLESQVKGLLSFYQEDENSDLFVIASVKGLNPYQLHGIHIH